MGNTTVTLKGNGLKDMQSWDIQISIEATVNIDAQTARRRVTVWLVNEVGNMLVGGAPQLVIGTKTVWRVPALLTSSQAGILGEVGAVEVDGETGELLINATLSQEILNNVEKFSRPPLSTTG